MSYQKAMKWHKKHPKGTKQPMLFSTGSGFWPSWSFLNDCFFPYLEQCKKEGIEPLECEAYYKLQLRRTP